MLNRRVVKGIRNVTYVLSTFYTINLLLTLSDTILGKGAMFFTGIVFQTLEVFLFYVFQEGKAFGYKVSDLIKNICGSLFLILFTLSIVASLSYNMNETNNSKNNSKKNSRAYKSIVAEIEDKKETRKVYKKYNRVTDANVISNEILQLEKSLENKTNTELSTKGYTSLLELLFGKEKVNILEFVILAIVSITLEIICILCCYLVEFKLENENKTNSKPIKTDSKPSSKPVSVKVDTKPIKKPQTKIEPVTAKRKIGFGDMQTPKRDYTKEERKTVEEYMLNELNTKGEVKRPFKSGEKVNGWNKTYKVSGLNPGIVKDVRTDLLKEGRLRTVGNSTILVK